MKAFRIKGWNRHYENNRSRELRRPEWFPCSNSFEGRGYMELCDNPAGTSHYGAWCMLLAVASRMPTRGLLVTDSGHALSIKDIARMTRGCEAVFMEAIPRLLAIGWVEEVEHVTTEQDGDSDDSAGPFDTPPDAASPHDGAGIPQHPAGKVRLNKKGKGNLNSNPSAAAAGLEGQPGGSDGGRTVIQGMDRPAIIQGIVNGAPLDVIAAFGGARDEMRDAEWLRDGTGLTVYELAAILWVELGERHPVRQPSGLRAARQRWAADPIDDRRETISIACADIGIPSPFDRKTA